MTGQPEHVLVIGAGLGGVRTAEQLRTAGYQGRISLVGAEAHVPYDRPPLSKQILTGEWEPGRAILRTLDQLEELGVRAHLGLAAVALRPGEVELSDGSTLYGDAVVVATGLVARRLPDQPAHVHTLRTLDDSLALRATLDRVGSLLIVGAGFIGAEVATAARARGIAVTVLEALPVPAGRGARARRSARWPPGCSPRPASTCGSARSWPGSSRPRPGRGPAGRRQRGRRPTPGWSASAGCRGWTGSPATAPGPRPRRRAARADPAGGCTAGSGVWAVGDVALVGGPEDGTAHRHEHWTSAGDQAAVVARDILGADPPPPAVPYFWSDQFGLKIQLLGRPEGGRRRAAAARRGLRRRAGARHGRRVPRRRPAGGRGRASAPPAWWPATAPWWPTARDRAAAPTLTRPRRRPRRPLATLARECTGGTCARVERDSVRLAEHLRRTASAISAPTAIRPYRIRGSASLACTLCLPGVGQPLRAGPLAQRVQAVGERVPGLLDLALDGLRVARHSDSSSRLRVPVPP